MDWTQIIVALIGMFGIAITAISTNKSQSNKSTKEIKDFITNNDNEIKANIKSTNEKIKSLEEQFANHIKANEDEKHNQYRSRILVFDDELRLHLKHSQEHFEDILAVIDKYEAYCQKHPDYKNSKAKISIAHIQEVYKRTLEENDFLK